MQRLRVARTGAVRAPLPEYMSEGASGLDLFAALADPLVLPPGGRARVPTGFVVEIPQGHEGQVRPRSGLAFKHGVTVANAPGTIDTDYRGELMVLLINLGPEPFRIEPLSRIAQLVVAPVQRVAVEEVGAQELSSSGRGGGGFGSTG